MGELTRLLAALVAMIEVAIWVSRKIEVISKSPREIGLVANKYLGREFM